MVLSQPVAGVVGRGVPVWVVMEEVTRDDEYVGPGLVDAATGRQPVLMMRMVHVAARTTNRGRMVVPVGDSAARPISVIVPGTRCRSSS